MATLPRRPERDFEAVRADFERAMSLLKTRPLEVAVRVRLLRELRMLLDEADRLMDISPLRNPPG